MEMEEIARWIYIGFIVIAIIAGLALGYQAAVATDHFADATFQEYNGWVTLLMFIFGIIIALAGSITTKEIGPFLIATIALLVVGVGDVWSPLLQVEVLSGAYYVATVITRYIAALAAPIAVIIAIRQIHAMAKEK
jgi:hypothetical protein